MQIYSINIIYNVNKNFFFVPFLLKLRIVWFGSVLGQFSDWSESFLCNNSQSSDCRRMIYGWLKQTRCVHSNDTKIIFLISIDGKIIFKYYLTETLYLLMRERWFWYHSKALDESYLRSYRLSFCNHWMVSYCMKTILINQKIDPKLNRTRPFRALILLIII